MKILLIYNNLEEAKEYIEKQILNPKEFFKKWPDYYELENGGYIKLVEGGLPFTGSRVDRIYIPKGNFFDRSSIYVALKYSKEKIKIVYY